MELHPDTVWYVAAAPKEITKDYGKGYMLSGRKGEFNREYFILLDDPRTDTWINLIVSELDREIKEYVNGR